MTSPGKTVGQRTYVHSDRVAELPAHLFALAQSAAEIAQARGRPTFNVVRVDAILNEVAFLDYPTLGTEPFPPLSSSCRVHVPSQLVTNRRFDQSLNPPILHRTELILPPAHQSRVKCIDLTAQCEQLGLFDNSSIIGFQRAWLDLIKQRGYSLSGFKLVPQGNVIDQADDSVCDPPDTDAIFRHRTALSRTALSAPMQGLLRDNLLKPGTTLFDYGCGKGDDLATLEASGFSVAGWDPYFRATAAKTPAEIVNIGFVINVIEDKDERISALLGAYALTKQVLCVSAMLLGNESTCIQAYSDGVVTSRRTFQKYYSQGELQQFIENVLDEDAYPAAPGIFYVFRDRQVEQTYLLAKSSNRSRVARARLAVIHHVRAPRPPKAQKVKREETPEAQELQAHLWELCLELGRAPEIDEVNRHDAMAALFGSLKRATNACLANHDSDALAKAAAGRRDDILVMLALRSFERRKRMHWVDARLKRDIREFFGSMAIAEANAQALLFSVKDKALIASACEEAATLGLGWLESAKSLQLHTSFAERLPAALRVYIGCAMAMVGDLKSYDLVKIHIESGKVTLLQFDDFIGKPLPALQTRIKVRLLDQDLDIFSYGQKYPPTVLLNKSQYINEEFAFYAEQLEFEASLARLNAFDLNSYGPTEEVLERTLRALRWEIRAFDLVRSTSIPAISDPCGAHYSFRQLIHCGDTWERLQMDNTPRSPETYNALADLAAFILDPVIEYFGGIRLTYGFASKALTKHIKNRIEPSIDQHASCEIGRGNSLVCTRQGAAVDFLIEDEDMREVAKWIASHCPFDRIYFYGSDRPLHVSVGPERSGKIIELVSKNGRQIPRALHF